MNRQVPLKLCVTLVCVLGAVACTFVRVPGNVACALVCIGLAMVLPDIMIDLPKSADEMLAEALEENRALKALLKTDMDVNYSDSGSSAGDSESDSGSSDASKCSRHTL